MCKDLHDIVYAKFPDAATTGRSKVHIAMASGLLDECPFVRMAVVAQGIQQSLVA